MRSSSRDDAVIFGDALGDVPVADVHGALHHELEAAPDEVLEIVRIEAGVPRFGVDYTTDHLPQEAGLTSVVPIDKGCYVGQETVARIHFRGHVNKVTRADATRRCRRRDRRRSDAPRRSTESASGRSRRLRARRARGDVAIGMVRVEPPEGAELDVEGGGTAILGPVPAGTKVKT